MQIRHIALLCIPVVLILGCGRKATPVKPPVAAAPAEKKVVKPDPEFVRQQEEKAKKARELKEAREKELAKIKATQEADAKAKKQIDDARLAFVDDVKNRANLRAYRREVERTKESEASIKSLKLRIGELLDSNDANKETLLADLDDQLKEEERRVVESAKAAKSLFAKLREKLPKELPLSDDELTKLAFSVPPPPALEVVQAKYERYPSKVLKIAEPVEIKQVAYSKEGGSIVWLFVDKDKNQHAFRTLKGPNGTFHYSKDSKDEKGKALDEGGEEQKELYGLWVRWIKKNLDNPDAFLNEREAPRSIWKHNPASLGQSFRELERRIVVVAEKGEYPGEESGQK